MAVVGAIAYLHLGLVAGLARLQDRQPSSELRLSRHWNASQISALARSPGGDLDAETSDAATRFLYTGDPATLLRVNCSRRVEIRGAKGEAAVSLHPLVHGAIDTMVHATNFLNLVFQTNDIRESSVKDDIEWYHALVRSIVEADPKIYRALLTLDVPATPPKSQLVLRATRERDAIFLQDVSPSHSAGNQTSDGEWFHALKYQKIPRLNKRLLNNDLQTLDTPKWSQGDSYMVDKSHVKWSRPFLDCVGDKLVPKWMVTMSTSFYGLKPDLSPEFKGVVQIDINLESLDIDQCSTGDGWFADSHRCDVKTTKCSPLKGQGFQLGAYQCVCKEGYYNPNLISTNSNDRQGDENIFFSRFAVDEPRMWFQCLPCKTGCSSCVSDAPCFIQEDRDLRLAIVSFQTFSMLLVFISMLVVYRFRKNKRIRASGLLLLETILGGAILLYFPVFILYFQPSAFRCVLLRWVRMLGFAIIYGTITLKIYRVLKVFLSRTAQRVPYMTCTRLLKMLGVIVLTVCWFLIAWTAAAWENVERKIPLVTQSQTPDGQTFKMCQLDRWDYMMATAEFLFLCWGSYLCYTVRMVPSTYHEPRFMGLAIHNEILMSAAFCSLRFTMATTLHPDWMLLLFFVHTHLTVTLTLILLLAPKFLHVGVSLREDIVAEVYEDDLDMRCSGSYLNSSITSAWSEHSLDPEDIRDELKKLYAQLEIHKTKKMTTNNPHLHKKRSSRKGLGRSIIKRITEIPDSVSRQCSRVERGGSIGAGSSTGSYKKKFNEPSSSSMKVKEDSIKHRVFSIRKSHSTYDHMRGHRDGHTGRMDSSGKDPSLLDSLMRKKLAKKASERSDTESLDAAPLVCKSASAHNLTVGKPSVHTKPGTLQKSLSVVTCAKEKGLMLTRKCEENSKQVGERGQKTSTKHASASLQLPTVATQPEEEVKLSNSDRQQTTGEGTARLLVQDGRNRTLIGPPESQNLQPPSSETKVHTQVNYSRIKISGIDRSHSSGKLDHRKKAMDLERKHHSFRHCGTASSQGGDVKEVATIRSEDKVPARKHSGANTSTRFGKSAESPKTDAIHPTEREEFPSKTSGKMGQVQTEENKRERYISLIKQASSNSAIICPWDIMEEDTSTVSTSVDQKKGRSLSVCTVAPETLIHGSFKSKTTNLSLKQPKRFGLSFKHLMTPGKMKGNKREKSAIISEKEKGSPDKEAVGSMDKSTSTEFCPQGKENRNKEDKSQPIDTSSDTSPLEAGHSGSKREKYMSLLKQGSANTAIICPWDVVLKETSATKITEDLKKGRSLSVSAGVPGSSLQGTLNANTANSSLQQSKRLALSLKLLMSPGKEQNRENKDGKSLPTDKSKVSDICPWDPGDARSKEKSLPSDKSKGMHNCPLGASDTEKKQDKRLSVDKSKLSDIYPSTNTAIICPWDIVLKETSAMSTSGDQKKGRSLSVCAGLPGSFLQGTLNANYASGLLPQNKRLALSMKLLMSPGKVRNRENKDGKLQPIDQSKVADICPWDSGDTKNQETSLPIDKSKAADICPWDSGDTKNKETSLSIDKSKVAEICPWDSGDSKNQETSLPIDKSKAADICPWDSGDTKNTETSLSIDKSKVAEICPWDSGDSKNQESLLSIDTSKVADICPWDSGDTKNQETSLPIDKSKAADICPWDSGDTKNKETLLSIDKSKVAEICPWDSGDSKNQETSLPIDKCKLENICPWDADDTEREVVKSSSIDESKFAIICPWDTVSPENSETRINEDQKKGRSQSVCAGVSGSTMQDPLKAKVINDALPQSKWLALSLKLRTASEKTKDREIKGKSLLNNKSKVVDICPRETGDYQCKETLLSIDKAKVADICPWETGDTQSNEEKSQPKDKSNLADVCPWETGTLATGESQPGTKDKSDITSICPGDMEAETTVQAENKEEGKRTDKGNIAGSADSCP